MSLASATLTLTATRRLAQYLRDAHGVRQCAAGLSAWASPDILPLHAWLERCWEDALSWEDARVLLSPHAELALWEEIINASPAGRELLWAGSAAREAAAAWRTLRQWNLSWEALRAAPSEDAQAFAGWARSFATRLQERAWLDGASLATAVTHVITAGGVELPARVIKAGFDDDTPQQRALWAALQGAGVAVEDAPEITAHGQVQRVAVTDAETEVRVAARWARDGLMQGASRVGIVVHDLATRRALIERLFTAEFAPSTLLPGTDPVTPLWNISLAPPLLDAPVVAAGLDIVRFALSGVTLEEGSRLLRSPFLAGAGHEEHARARLDARLRLAGAPHIDMARVLRVVTHSNACPLLHAALERLRAARATWPPRQRLSLWASSFAQALRAVGWPGERGLDSREYQTVQAWKALLAECAALDEVLGRISASTAMARLRTLAQHTPFQPQAAAHAPLQILGTLEAAGLAFDQVWVMGLHDEVWPPTPRPNPFLPLVLQRDHDMPHASLARELALARRITARLCAAAPQVVLSHPQREEDRHLRASPLIAHYPELALNTLHTARDDDYARQLRRSARWETRVDVAGPPWLGPGAARGGARLFELQSACAFRAFAECRLQARTLAVEEPWPTPGMRGAVLHAALCVLWRDLGSHSALCALPDDAAWPRVRIAVTAALMDAQQQRPQHYLPQYVALEQARLESLLMEWLGLERQRAAFHVEALEEERTLQCGGLSVQVRIDRVDRLADGGVVIIDYKTGPASPGDWFGPRPVAPQLPLYHVTSPEPVAALVFGVLRAPGLQFKGLGQRGGLLPEVPPFAGSRYDFQTPAGQGDAWAAVQAEWLGVLQHLADQFQRGAAEVAPRDDKACRHCALPTLCRIHEHGLGGEAEVLDEG